VPKSCWLVLSEMLKWNCKILWGNLLACYCRVYAATPIAFLGTFGKIAIDDYYIGHVCLSVPPSFRMEQLGSQWTNFHVILFEHFFESLSRKVNFYQNRTRTTGTLRETNTHLWSNLSHFFLEWEMFKKKVVDKVKTHILCSATDFFLSSKIVLFMR